MVMYLALFGPLLEFGGEVVFTNVEDVAVSRVGSDQCLDGDERGFDGYLAKRNKMIILAIV